MIDTIMKNSKLTSDCSKMSTKCDEHHKIPWEQQTKQPNCSSDNRFPSCSSSGINRPKCYLEHNYKTCEASQRHKNT